MINFQLPTPATGDALDRLAHLFSIKRKTYFWIFKESDKKLRLRIREYITKKNKGLI